MPTLPHSLQQWQSGAFENTLKSELENAKSFSLPLEKATSQGGYIDDSDISVTVIRHKARGNSIQAKVGIFFTEIIVGCSCGDDPLPVNAYCEMLISIDRNTAEAEFEVIPA